MSKLEDVEIYAWVGEDEYGSGIIGIKRALTNQGVQPLVTTKKQSALKMKDVCKHNQNCSANEYMQICFQISGRHSVNTLKR